MKFYRAEESYYIFSHDFYCGLMNSEQSWFFLNGLRGYDEFMFWSGWAGTIPVEYLWGVDRSCSSYGVAVLETVAL